MTRSSFGSRGRAPDRERALRQYRAHAAGYDATCARIHGIRDAAIEMLRLAGGETVFDVACGTGATLLTLAQRVGPEGSVVGIEQSAEMAGLAQARVQRARLEATVTVLLSAVEDATLPAPADALLLCYTHDVLQNAGAVGHLMRHVRPGARVAVAGIRFLPWWWGAPLNAFTGWRARRYLTTFRGLRAPCKALEAYCPDLRVVQSFHLGTSYLAAGTVDRPRPGPGA